MTGIEYVLVAYGIWICTFVIYIFTNKKRQKTLNKTIAALGKKNPVSTENNTQLEKNEIKE
tara:strand:+ start:292 stop:474 length:183 start_codon:yes stop_codon:yes gene_type:complete